MYVEIRFLAEKHVPYYPGSKTPREQAHGLVTGNRPMGLLTVLKLYSANFEFSATNLEERTHKVVYRGF